nr:hypothetical protein [Tanacetum cinerariifolium]
QTSLAGAFQQLSSGNTSSLAVTKYSSSGIFITGSGNDLSILFPTRSVIYRDMNNQKKMMRESEVHKFSEAVFLPYLI